MYYQTLESAREALEAGLADTAADAGLTVETLPDDYAFDLVVNVACDSYEPVARELCRTELGYVPSAVEEMFDRPGRRGGTPHGATCWCPKCVS